MTKEIRFMETVLRDGAGYHSIEMWGGATFDSCIRYLNEDPWERLRTIRKEVKNAKLQMLLRGQNLLGYKHYSDDVVSAFVEKSIENGIDVVRVEFHTVDYFVGLTKEMAKMGADSICIKDMAGVLTPAVAFELVSKIKAAVDLPLEVHTHATSGIAEMTYLKAVEAGAQANRLRNPSQSRWKVWDITRVLI